MGVIRKENKAYALKCAHCGVVPSAEFQSRGEAETVERQMASPALGAQYVCTDCQLKARTVICRTRR